MSSFERKLRRKKEKKAEKELADKVGLFDKLPAECSACLDPFDKKNKEMLSNWNVVVREQEETVRLYCPDCWSKAQEFIKKMEADENV